MNEEAEKNDLRYYESEGCYKAGQVVRFSFRPFHAAEVQALVENGDCFYKASAASSQTKSKR